MSCLRFCLDAEKPNDAMKRFQPPANVFTVASFPAADKTAVLRHMAQRVLRFFELHEQLRKIVVPVGEIRIGAHCGFVSHYGLGLAIHVFEQHAEIEQQQRVVAARLYRIAIHLLGPREVAAFVQ